MNNIRNEKYLKAFGAHLRKLRKKKALSMEQLSYAADIEYSQIAKIETGKINTTISTVFLLAQVLEVNVHELFKFEFPEKTTGGK